MLVIDTLNSHNDSFCLPAWHRNNTYSLRAHHGLCLFFFAGKGYSSEFVANMADIKSQLDKNPLVCITGKADLICSKCPNNIKGRCKTEAKVAEYDNQVLSRCNLKDGDVLRFYEFQKLILHNILLPGKREEVCGNCRWTSMCKY